MDKVRCPSCTAEYYTTEFECPACGARNPAFDKPALRDPLPTRDQPKERGPLASILGLVALVLACAIGGAFLLRGDVMQKKQHDDLLAELTEAFSGVTLGTSIGALEMQTVVVDDLELKEPIKPLQPIGFEGYLDSPEGRAGYLSGVWDRPKGRISYTYAYDVEVDNRTTTVSGEGELYLEKKGPPSKGPARKK